MRYDDHGTPVGDLPQILADDRFAVGVESACGFIENEQTGIGDQRPRDGETLLLPTREIGSIFFEHRFQAAGKPLDELLGSGDASGGSNLLDARIRLGCRDIVTHGSAKEEAVLKDDADALPEMDKIDLAAVEAVYPNKPLLDRVEPLDKPGDRRLARAAPADDAKDRAGWNGEGDVVERRRSVGPIAERHVVELDPPLELGPDATSAADIARGAGS